MDDGRVTYLETSRDLPWRSGAGWVWLQCVGFHWEIGTQQQVIYRGSNQGLLGVPLVCTIGGRSSAYEGLMDGICGSQRLW
ncbi:hypothetical protein DAPPUDRAFT_274989 [Daphnia pulex]|uniref:Uncharacterized protein n=1 Tax=Daphnia pulex TaxID=6669 RepID=E9I505_DAPPU|nr:hypothetical protein DAPPUDRAFT_274989 [Daphnia pulex]|eukprot:EFX60925.1 hypothetical protein DAPPUDRAFT_274989 [Daphnia pulex]